MMGWAALVLLASASSTLEPELTQQHAVCAPSVADCFQIRLHVAEAEGAPVVDAAWLGAQLERVAHHFGPSDIGFVVSAVSRLGATHTHIATRQQRDLLGRTRLTSGGIDVFVVGRLDNVDAEGEIRGVHWRDRKDRGRRWIILSAISAPDVLAHELGHFFGLPHSRAAASIMNKRPRAKPPSSERSFVRTERARIEARARSMAASGRLQRLKPAGGR